MLQLIVATKNKKKLEEIKDIFSDIKLKVLPLSERLAAVRIIENGRTFKENAVKKAVKIALLSGKLTMGEDSGLCVNALGGAPGVRSARFSGRNKDDTKNNLKLLKMLGGLPLSKRRSHYVCAVAIADKNGLIGVVEGKCFGLIGFKMAGNSGFGYDPLFIIPKYKKTFAQLGAIIKHKMSHRYRALLKTRKMLSKYCILNSRQKFFK